MRNQVFYAWKEAEECKLYRSGVSLHSHTNLSREHLSFLLKLSNDFAPLKWILDAQKKKAAVRSRISMDLDRAFWTPPLSPRLVYESERAQIEESLGLKGIVSITDHDTIEASTRLRVLPESESAPISVEWSVPFHEAEFHLGVHNLPPAKAASFLYAFEEYRAKPSFDRLAEILRALSEVREVLVILNHPKWNLEGLESDRYDFLLREFLWRYSAWIHGLELNGLRSWKENQAVVALASAWNQIVVSGGDRHGCEANANVNLSSADCFEEFVEEVRVRRISRVMFMRHYADPIAIRYFQGFLDVIVPNDALPRGSRNWDDRTWHPDRNGELKPLSALWRTPPGFLERLFSLVSSAGAIHASERIRASWRKELVLRLAPYEPDGAVTVSQLSGEAAG